MRPLMTNSDHANFAQGGIPALRLVAGFDDPAANLRSVLTPADTRDKIGRARLHRNRVHGSAGRRGVQRRPGGSGAVVRLIRAVGRSPLRSG